MDKQIYMYGIMGVLIIVLSVSGCTTREEYDQLESNYIRDSNQLYEETEIPVPIIVESPVIDISTHIDGSTVTTLESGINIDVGDNQIIRCGTRCNIKCGTKCNIICDAGCNIKCGDECTLICGNGCNIYHGKRCSITHGNGCNVREII